MTTTISNSNAERRRHRRLDSDIAVVCRRIGGRPTPERPMRVLDISHGGVRMVGSGHFLTGDVVLISLPVDGKDLDLKGLVVSSSLDAGRDGGHLARVAFTSMSTADADRLGRLLEQVERLRVETA